MTNVIKNLDLDNPSDELKDDEALNAISDRMNSPNLDPARTHAATLALAFHNALSEPIHDYDQELIRMGLTGDRALKDVHIVAALLTLALATAHALSNTGIISPPLSSIKEMFLLKEAGEIARDISADIGKALLNLDAYMRWPRHSQKQGRDRRVFCSRSQAQKENLTTPFGWACAKRVLPCGVVSQSVRIETDQNKRRV